VDIEAAGDHAVDDVLDLLFGCAFLHYDDHVSSSTPQNILRGTQRPLQKSAATKFEKSLRIFLIW
jgi:hypothetical protein